MFGRIIITYKEGIVPNKCKLTYSNGMPNFTDIEFNNAILSAKKITFHKECIYMDYMKYDNLKVIEFSKSFINNREQLKLFCENFKANVVFFKSRIPISVRHFHKCAKIMFVNDKILYLKEGKKLLKCNYNPETLNIECNGKKIFDRNIKFANLQHGSIV